MAEVELLVTVSVFDELVVRVPLLRVKTPEMLVAPLRLTPAELLMVRFAGVFWLSPLPVFCDDEPL